MIFDSKKKKGIRRKLLPKPNPTKVEMPKDSSIFEVFQKAVQLYYKEFSNITFNDVILADSSGNPIDIEDMANWKLGEYYSKHQFIPSRHKLYTMIGLSKVSNCKLCESGIIISKLCYRQVMIVKMCYPKLETSSLKMCKMGQEQKVLKKFIITTL